MTGDSGAGVSERIRLAFVTGPDDRPAEMAGADADVAATAAQFRGTPDPGV